MTVTIYADCEDLALDKAADDSLSSAIEERAEQLLSLGVSVTGIAEAAEQMVERAAGPGWRVAAIPDAGGAELVFAVVRIQVDA